MSDDFNLGIDVLNDLESDVDALLESATSWAQIGRVHFSTTLMAWDATARLFNEIASKEEWRGLDCLKFVNVGVTIVTTEFNPERDNDYERRVQWKRALFNKKLENGEREKIPSDWFFNLEPSLCKVAQTKDALQAMRKLEGKYVKVLDVLQQATKQHPEPTYNTPKFVEVYEGREQAYAAYQEISGGSGAATTETTETVAHEQDIIDAVKQLHEAGSTLLSISKDCGITVVEVKEILGV